VQLSSADLFEKEGLMGGMPTDLSLLALVARIDVQCMDRYDRRHGEIHDGVLHLRPDKTTAVLVSDAGFSQTIDKPDETSDSTLKILRDTGMIGPGNRSDGRSVFQSATGEILAETPRHFMQIDTPRFQGICAEAGEKASLADVTVESLSENGVLAVVSIDGHKPVKDAERLMVVYASNALNSGMQFGDKEMTILKYVGDHPALLKRGRFSITIRNANAKRLSLYPLDFSGKRLREIQPSKIHGTQASFDVDTLKDGGTVFFEVQARP